MDERIKNALGAVGVIAMAVVAVAALSLSSTFAGAAPAAATFSVTGQGKATGSPDVAQFSFGVVTEGGMDIAALQRDNVAKANAAIEFVKSQGVEDKDIETLNYDVQPRYQRFDCRPEFVPGAQAEPCPPPEIAGYSVTQTVQVKVRDFSKTGDLIAGVTARGANNISGLSFTVDNPSALQNEARAKAIEDAKSQAEDLADAGDFKLGRLVSVSENGGYQPFYREVSLAQDAATGNGAPVPAPSIQPGSDQITATVTLTYEIR